jgi:hypothetical protein
MPVERREQVIAVELGSTGVRPGGARLFSGRRQPSCDGTSRMTRECQVRICERLGVKFPGPTRHSRRCQAGPPRPSVSAASPIATEIQGAAACREVPGADIRQGKAPFGFGQAGPPTGGEPRLPALSIHRIGSRSANHSFGSAARTRASGRPSSRRTKFVPSTSATHL